MSDPRPPHPTDSATGEWSSLTSRESARPDSPTLTASGSGPSSGELGIPNPFGRYTITRLLGRGGMGAVFLAHDTQLDRPVALKIPSFRGTLSTSQKQRFFREARAVAALRHPNICPVIDVDETQDTLYLTMAYIDGQTLAGVLQSGPIEPIAAGRLIRRVARAMQAAHEHGTIHRDLKPANIMIDPVGSPVIMDFGLARRGDVEEKIDGEAETTTVSDAGLTQVGSVLGTPAYMPPEQATGDLNKIGPRSDVYALGAVLYECLTGKRPFDGPDTASVIQKILTSPPPQFREHIKGIDPELEAVCFKALAKKPEDRHQSMEEFATALQEAIEPKLEFAAPPPLPGRRTVRPAKRKRWVSPLGCFAISACLILTCIGGSTLAVWWLIDRVTDKVNDMKQAVERSNAEWDAIQSFWKPPPADAGSDVLFPSMLPKGYRRTSTDSEVADSDLGISLEGKRGIYVGPQNEKIEVRAYPCPEAEAKQVQKRAWDFVTSVSAGTGPRSDNPTRRKVMYSANNPAFKTVTFGFSESNSQDYEFGKIWYGYGWLFYFKTSEPLLIESFPSQFLMELGKRVSSESAVPKKKSP